MPSGQASDVNGDNGSRSRRVLDTAMAGVVVSLIALGAATALAFVAGPLFWMPYPSNLKGAAIGLALLVVVLGVLKFVCGGLIEILLALGVFGALACLIYPSVHEQRERQQNLKGAPVAARNDEAESATRTDSQLTKIDTP